MTTSHHKQMVPPPIKNHNSLITVSYMGPVLENQNQLLSRWSGILPVLSVLYTESKLLYCLPVYRTQFSFFGGYVVQRPSCLRYMMWTFRQVTALTEKSGDRYLNKQILSIPYIWLTKYFWNLLKTDKINDHFNMVTDRK